MNMQRLPTRERSSESSMSEDARPLRPDQIGRESGESDREDSVLQLDAFDVELEEGNQPRKAKRQQKSKPDRQWIWFVFGTIFVVWLLALIVYATKGRWRKVAHSHSPIAHIRRVTFDDTQSPKFYARQHNVDWTDAHGQDGMYLIRKDGHIKLANVDGSESVFIDEQDVRWKSATGESRQLVFDRYFISADMKYVLFATGVEHNWRHSFFANYWIYDTTQKTTNPLIPSRPDIQIAFAVWSPTGHSIAYVVDNNIVMRRDLGDAEQVTTDGSPGIFNGIPDWVFEEEVFQTNSAIWWAPDSSAFAFLRTDDTAVNTYPLEFYISPDESPELYPLIDSLKYPKPGTPNPRVTLYFYEVGGGKSIHIPVDGDFADEDRLITEVKWLGSKEVLVRETNRVSDLQKSLLINFRQNSGKVTRAVNVTAIDGGWFEVSRNAHYVPANFSQGRADDGYIDVVIHEGYNHLAYFSPIDSDTPQMLTLGPWEVVDGVRSIDLFRGLVYFISTKKSALERHLYSVALETLAINAVTDDSKEGYYGVNFSPNSGYYTLNYNGPGIPWQSIESTDDSDFSIVLENNTALADTLSHYDLPSVIHSTIVIDGLEMNTEEIRPPNFDASGRTKYPVLFRVYGGPISQTVDKKFSVDFHTWLASDPTTEYIVVTVDGRGTGFMGRKLRVPIRNQLGRWESHDQIEAAKQWMKNPYVDPRRMAIWGWSFGAFTTLKTLENGPGVFKYGMAVAPVTDWRYYDSIYTERYMRTPEVNLQGYINSAVTNVSALSEANRFLIMHGSGDDNVHYQNTLNLIDKLTLGEVDNYDMHIFPDSDHSIYFHNANKAVYRRLAKWLMLAFGVRNPEENSWYQQQWEH